jgi:hypothetical protein
MGVNRVALSFVRDSKQAEGVLLSARAWYLEGRYLEGHPLCHADVGWSRRIISATVRRWFRSSLVGWTSWYQSIILLVHLASRVVRKKMCGRSHLDGCRWWTTRLAWTGRRNDHVVMHPRKIDQASKGRVSVIRAPTAKCQKPMPRVSAPGRVDPVSSCLPKRKESREKGAVLVQS